MHVLCTCFSVQWSLHCACALCVNTGLHVSQCIVVTAVCYGCEHKGLCVSVCSGQRITFPVGRSFETGFYCCCQQAGWPKSFQGHCHLCPPHLHMSAGVICRCLRYMPGFYIGSRDSSLGPHNCEASDFTHGAISLM